MDKLVGLAIISLALNTGCSLEIKETEVPLAILDSFRVSFKDVKVNTWDKEEGGGYEAEFNYIGVETSATFNSAGKLSETEQEIKKSALPHEISEYVSKNYSGKVIQEAAKITTSEGSIMYEVEINKKDLMFDDKGNFLK